MENLEDIAKLFPDLPRSCKDLASSGKIFEEIQDGIQDLFKISKICTKKSSIDSKNIFVEHVVLLQATLPET